MKRWILALLVMLAASPGWAKPSMVGPNHIGTAYTVTWTFDATTEPTPIFGVVGSCDATWVRGGSETVTLYQTTASTATGGVQVGSTFTATSTAPVNLIVGQPNVYAVSDGASAGGKLTILCSPFGMGGDAEGWTDAGNAIVADDAHDVIVGGDEDDVCETGEICLDESTGVLTAEGFVARDQASGSNFNEFDDNATTVPSAPSGSNVRLYTTDDGELYKKDADDGTGDGNRLFTAQDFRRYPFYFTDLLSISAITGTDDTTTSIWDYAAIISGTSAVVTGTANHPGVVQITSSANANSGAYMLTGLTSFTLGGGEVSESVFKVIPASGTALDFKTGFLDTGTSGTALDGVYLQVVNSLTPDCKSVSSEASGGNTTTAFASPITIDTWYRAKISIKEDGTEVYCSLYADGSDAPIETITITTENNIPTENPTGHGIVATTTGSSAVALVQIDYMAMYSTKRLVR